MAVARFINWLRSLSQATTMPVGKWVKRTAESVLLTCWPPFPPERYVSTRKSLGSILTSIVSSKTGNT